ncbi:MAG: hydroxymethylbilane synthase [Actinomycetia bacterium]|nr:hydroxymethylbilane synthase [Actinomycetes bacterium]MCP4227180.1 hydroxymethylbilane synthase [Actinomycetes bacterium]MCP5030309.1 hydroxymethylbilane synthase [Actinomycetes bacterium]
MVKIRIATRRSPLALWQANHVASLLAKIDQVEPELVAIDTAPDLDLSQSISDIGGKGAFSKEVQTLVLAGQADIAVHSAKDLQAITPEGLVIGAYPERGAMADCLVGSRLAELAPGATVATGSNRRRALLLDIRPDLEIVGLRGNVGTRLQKLAEADIAAIVVARAALERLGERPDVVEELDVETFIPQVGQGSLAVECRAEDTMTADLLSHIDHEPTRTTVSAERDFLVELGGDCDLPAGANAILGSDDKLTIRGVLASPPDVGGRLQRADVVELALARPGQILARRLRAAANVGS